MNYRREIDGLRALAVFPVILFHAGFKIFSGGFVGVDVFFVISGYLITSIIFAEKKAGTFSLSRFYERRARRILPALVVVMLACLPFAWLLLMPSDMKSFSRSLVATVAFSSNILFWRQSGYFDAAAELKPLLHTWSLAVEEQYYLIFPIFLLLTWRLGKRWIAGILACVAAISLIAAQWGSLNDPAAAFFLLTTRGWELLIGVACAIYLFEKNSNETTIKKTAQCVRELISFVGLALITCAVIIFDKQTPFPGFYALVPTIGAASIILFATPQTWVGRCLGHPFLVGVGLISYSAYLWHQPLFVFARYFNFGQPNDLTLIALSLASFLLAILSWKYVETPFRDRTIITQWKLFGFGLIGITFIYGFGLFGFLNGGYPGRAASDLSKYFAPEKSNEEELCTLTALEGNGKIGICFFGDTSSDYQIALYGDSHVGSLSAVFDEEFKNEKIRGVRTRLVGCEVIPGVVWENNKKMMENTRESCEASFDQLVSYFSKHVDGIVVADRWTQRLYPIPGLIDSLMYDNGEGGVELGVQLRKHMAFSPEHGFTYNGAEKENAIKALLSGLSSLNKPVFLVYPIPEVGWDISRMNYEMYRQGKSLALATISTSYQRFKERNQFINNVLDRITGSTIIRIKPDKIFCDTYVKDRCIVETKGVPFYWDNSHLSNAGARFVVDEIMKHIRTE